MISFEFETNSEEINNQLIYSIGPISKLVDKFGQLFETTVKNKIDTIDPLSKIEMIFLDKNYLIMTTATVLAKELIINHRWEVIDRAIALACKNYNLNKYDIKNVKIIIPQLGDS